MNTTSTFRKAGSSALLAMLAAVGGTGSRAADDLVFANGYDDDAASQAPAECVPEPPLYPVFETRGLPATLRGVFAPNRIGAALSQVKLDGGTWEAYRFTRADLPSAFVEFQADTSNVGDYAVGADFRFVVIGECAGDFRAPSQAACSAYAGEGGFLYVNFGAPLAYACNLDPTRAYFFNVHVGGAPCNAARFANTCAFRIAVMPRG